MRRRMDLVALCTAGDSSDEAAVNQKLSCVASEFRAAFSHRNAHKYTKRRATRKHWKQRRTSARKRERGKGMVASRASCIVHRGSPCIARRASATYAAMYTAHRAPCTALCPVRYSYRPLYIVRDTRYTTHDARCTIHDTRHTIQPQRGPTEAASTATEARVPSRCECVCVERHARANLRSGPQIY